MSERDTLPDILYNDLSQAFKYIDKDGDGTLGVDDISYLLTTLGIGCNENSISVKWNKKYCNGFLNRQLLGIYLIVRII